MSRISYNKYVKEAQELLIKEGYWLGKAGADGKFGPTTLRAFVESIHSDEGKMDGVKAPIEFEPVADYDPPLRGVNEVIIHCTATPEGRPVTVADIDKWHRDRNWSGIGYHYVVYLDGSIHKGRNIEWNGAHVKGKNSGTIGVVYTGGVRKDNVHYAKDTRTQKQRESLLRLVRTMALDKRIVKISGHNQYAAKACPSFDVRNDELGNIPGFTKGARD